MTANLRRLARVFGAAVVIGALVLGWLQRFAVDSPTPEAGGEPTSGSETTTIDAPTAVTRRVIDQTPTNVPATPPSNDNRIAALTSKLAEFGYDKVGEGFVGYLTDQGLSQADSERIIRQAMKNMTACDLDALRVQAKVDAVSFGAVLDALEGDGFYWFYKPEVAALIDVGAFRQRDEECALKVRQQSGLPLQLSGVPQ